VGVGIGAPLGGDERKSPPKSRRIVSGGRDKELRKAENPLLTWEKTERVRSRLERNSSTKTPLFGRSQTGFTLGG